MKTIVSKFHKFVTSLHKDTVNKLLLTILMLFSVFFSFVNLGKWAFMDYDEASYATVYHESAVRNNFYTLTFLHKPWLGKPPLYFWLARGSSIVFGENEFALRLPAAILTTISVLLVFLIVLELTRDWTAALLSAAVLFTTAFFIFAGRQFRIDVPVTSAILFSFYSFLKARDKPFWFLIFGIGLASGILFKSVIGLLICPVIVLYSVIYKDYRWLKNKWFWIANVFTFVIIAPWHLYQTLLYGEKFWGFYLGHQVLGQVIGSGFIGGASDPFFYQFQQLFIVNQPWFLCFFIFFATFLISTRNKFKNYKFELFASTATISIFILFYIPQTRLLYYFTPMLPFMAMFIGVYAAKLLNEHRQIMLPLMSFLIIVGFVHTSLKIFLVQDRDFFLQPSSRISRYIVANDEKVISEIAAKEKIPLLLYNWKFVQTFIYYSDIYGGADIRYITKQSPFKPPYLLLIPTPFFKGTTNLPNPEKEGSEILYRGEAATLIKIYPK